MNRKYNIWYHDRILGLMLWWAIWDALGSPVDHSWIGSFPWVEDYQITARFYRWERTWDTAMALCLSEQLLSCWESRPDQQLYNYLRWHLTWYLWTRSYAKSEWSQIKSMINAYF
jgi:ADP-ribosylglycohydrolase